MYIHVCLADKGSFHKQTKLQTVFHCHNIFVPQTTFYDQSTEKKLINQNFTDRIYHMDMLLHIQLYTITIMSHNGNKLNVTLKINVYFIHKEPREQKTCKYNE